MTARAVLAPRRGLCGWRDAAGPVRTMFWAFRGNALKPWSLSKVHSVSQRIAGEIGGSRRSLALPTSVTIGDWSSFSLN